MKYRRSHLRSESTGQENRSPKVPRIATPRAAGQRGSNDVHLEAVFENLRLRFNRCEEAELMDLRQQTFSIRRTILWSCNRPTKEDYLQAIRLKFGNQEEASSPMRLNLGPFIYLYFDQVDAEFRSWAPDHGDTPFRDMFTPIAEKILELCSSEILTQEAQRLFESTRNSTNEGDCLFFCWNWWHFSIISFVMIYTTSLLSVPLMWSNTYTGIGYIMLGIWNGNA